MTRGLFIFFLLAGITQLHSQEAETDKLITSLKGAEGVSKVDILNQLMENYSCSDNGVALGYYSQIVMALKTSEYPKGELQSLRNYGALKYCSGNLDSTIHYYRKAIQIGEIHSLSSELTKLYSQLGFYFQTSGAFDSSASYLTKGLILAKEIGDSVTIGSTSLGLGTLFQHQGKIDTAIKSYFYALQIAEKIDHKPMFITAKLNISTFYYDHQPSKLRIADFLRLLEVTREIGDQKREVSVLEWLGYLYADSGKYEASIKYFNEGLEVNKIQKDQNSEILLLQGISYAHTLFGDQLKSIGANNQIIALAIASGYELYLPSMYVNNASNYVALNRYEEAVSAGLLAISTGKKTGQVELYYKVLPDLAMAYSKLGQLGKAYEMQLEYTKLSNEIFDSEKSRQFTEMETKYETKKKADEIALLSQQASIQALQIRQRNQAIIIGLIAILFALVVIYFVYKQRATKRRNSQIELEQRFLRSQLNPHFISNALLAVQNFMLKKQPEEAALYLTKFSKLMREILENSRKEFIPVEDEVKMLTNYLDIHKLRLSTFDYHIEIDEEIDPEMDTIPPMFIQPFVENAIDHGIINAKGQGHIELIFRKDGEYISIEVSDNGGGLTKSGSEPDHHSLSSTIIRERMELFNRSLKRKIQLVIAEMKNESGEVEGTKVELKVPFSYI